MRVPLLFARLFGQSYAKVSATATAARTDSRIMLVIDRSASMGAGPMAQAVAKAQAFTQTFTAGTDEVRGGDIPGLTDGTDVGSCGRGEGNDG